MRTAYEKGLSALSVAELGRLLLQLGLGCFVIDFRREDVSILS